MTAPLMLQAPPTKVVLCSYAYDVPHYYDFVVRVPAHLSDAEAEKEAEDIAQAALKDGLFSDIIGAACLENESNDRVFTSGIAKEAKDHEHDDELIELQVPATEGAAPRFKLQEHPL